MAECLQPHSTVTNGKTERQSYPSTRIRIRTERAAEQDRKKRGYGYKQQDGGNTTKNTKTRVCEQQKTLLIQQGLSRRRRPQVWLLWKKKQKEKRKETFLAPFFPFGSSHHLHLFTSGYHPNADYPPRCPTQVTHHPLRFIPFHRPSLPPSLPNTKSYSCPSRPFKSEHSSSRAQNAPLPHAAQWAPSHAHFPLAVPVVTKCCCCCIFLLSPVCVCVACVLCSRPSPPECRRKKKKKEKDIMRNEVEADIRAASMIGVSDDDWFVGRSTCRRFTH